MPSNVWDWLWLIKEQTLGWCAGASFVCAFSAWLRATQGSLQAVLCPPPVTTAGASGRWWEWALGSLGCRVCGGSLDRVCLGRCTLRGPWAPN